MQRPADPADDGQGGGIAQHHRRHVEAAEGDGGGLDADLQVVVAVDHGVFGVVGHRPEHVGEQQPPGFGRHAVEMGGIGHRDAEAEGDAQIGLRNGEEAFGEGIAGGEEDSRQREPDDERHAERQHEPEGQQAEGANSHSFPRSSPCRRSAGAPGALDVFVEIAVGVVVDDAAGRAHQHGAHDEDPDHDPVRPAQRRQPQGPQRRPDQQQDADGFCPAASAFRKDRVFP